MDITTEVEPKDSDSKGPRHFVAAIGRPGSMVEVGVNYFDENSRKYLISLLSGLADPQFVSAFLEDADLLIGYIIGYEQLNEEKTTGKNIVRELCRLNESGKKLLSQLRGISPEAWFRLDYVLQFENMAKGNSTTPNGQLGISIPMSKSSAVGNEYISELGSMLSSLLELLDKAQILDKQNEQEQDSNQGKNFRTMSPKRLFAMSFLSLYEKHFNIKPMKTRDNDFQRALNYCGELAGFKNVDWHQLLVR